MPQKPGMKAFMTHLKISCFCKRVTVGLCAMCVHPNSPGLQLREPDQLCWREFADVYCFNPSVLLCDPPYLSSLICETYHDRGFEWSLYLQNIVCNTWILIWFQGILDALLVKWSSLSVLVHPGRAAETGALCQPQPTCTWPGYRQAETLPVSQPNT